MKIKLEFSEREARLAELERENAALREALAGVLPLAQAYADLRGVDYTACDALIEAEELLGKGE